jgi:hypothetical protein
MTLHDMVAHLHAPQPPGPAGWNVVLAAVTLSFATLLGVVVPAVAEVIPGEVSYGGAFAGGVGVILLGGVLQALMLVHSTVNKLVSWQPPPIKITHTFEGGALKVRNTEDDTTGVRARPPGA